MGQVDAAVTTLQVPALNARTTEPWLARLRYAYADALVDAGRPAEARTWFARAAEVDPEGETDAQDRLDELDGFVFEEADEADGQPEQDVADDGPEQGRSREDGDA